MTDTAHIFVADGRRFEGNALILAGSLRLLINQSEKIIAYCPGSKIPEFTDFFIRMMDHYSVDILPIPEETNWSEPYPHGNKLLAAAADRAEERTVFFDTDTALLSSLSDLFKRMDENGGVCAVPEGVPTWGGLDEEIWRPVYEMFGLSIPDQRIKLVRGRQRKVLPYFNAGFAAWDCRDEVDFGKIWLETAEKIDQNAAIDMKRPWLDQISLPVALARSGKEMVVLPEKYNFGYFRRRFPLPDEVSVTLAHYHIPGIFRADPRCIGLYHRIVGDLPTDMVMQYKRSTGSFVRAMRTA